jgi:hypothetical protein
MAPQPWSLDRQTGVDGSGEVAERERRQTHHVRSRATGAAVAQDFGYLSHLSLDIPLGSAWYSCRLAREPLVIMARS